MRRALLVALFAAFAAGCVDDLVLPEPPSVEAGERAYDEPTATLNLATAERVLTSFISQLLDLEEIGGLRDVLDALVAFDREVEVTQDVDGEQTVKLRRVPIAADALIELTADCPGWGEDGVVSDAVSMTIIARDSKLVPTLWGGVDGCRVEGSREGVTVRAEVSGDVIAYVPTLLKKKSEVTRRIYLSYALREVIVEDRALPTWASDLRLVGTVLELRVDLAGEGHFIVFAGKDPGVIGVRAANGTWACYQEERRCERDSSSDSFSY